MSALILTNNTGCALTQERLLQVNELLLAYDWTTQKDPLALALDKLQIRGAIGEETCHLYDYEGQGWIIARREPADTASAPGYVLRSHRSTQLFEMEATGDPSGLTEFHD